MLIIFWICVAFILFAYVGYPLSMYLLSKIRSKKFIALDTYNPFISVIIASGNEGAKIYDKLLNTINSRFKGTMEIIVSLDGATDDTSFHVKRFQKNTAHSSRTIKLIENEKGGKESAQLAAIKIAKGHICVFTDVATTLRKNTLSKLIRPFFDQRVGAVDGMSKVVKDGHSSEGAYLKYENKIREWESATSGLVTLGGCLFAALTEMLLSNTKIGNKDYAGFVPGLSSDLRTALVAKTFGYHSIIETEAVAEFADGDEKKEFGRKHRTIVRGINNVFHNAHLFNPFKYGLFSYALFGHKIAKWLVPFFMIGAMVSNIALLYCDNIIFWSLMFGAQLTFYAIAFDSHIQPRSNNIGKLILFFCSSNLAILKAWMSYIQGERFVSWSPTKRKN